MVGCHLRVALPCYPSHLFRARLGESTSRLEQILHDHGIFLGLYHDIFDFRINFHHSAVYPD